MHHDTRTTNVIAYIIYANHYIHTCNLFDILLIVGLSNHVNNIDLNYYSDSIAQNISSLANTVLTICSYGLCRRVAFFICQRQTTLLSASKVGSSRVIWRDCVRHYGIAHVTFWQRRPTSSIFFVALIYLIRFYLFVRCCECRRH